ncbi:MAG: hypothetical protein Tsb0013_01830 [Phycisphaerales bacterium]
MSTLLCVPLLVDDVDRALADARLARDLGADLVEFRVDDVFSGEGDDEGVEAVLRLSRETPCACIVTCRSSEEGGSYDGDDSARISLYEALGVDRGAPAYVDVELSTFERSSNLRQKVRLGVVHPGQVKDLSTRLILSTHDFDGRPSDLSRRLGAMVGEGAAAVVKIAFRARSLRDNMELFELLAARAKPTIALGMGRFGVMSRVLAPKFGAFLTFASLRDEAATAPGQPTVAELLGRYRFRSIGGGTRVYGVIGWPAEHSIGPDLHNAVFEAVGHDGVYLPMPVAPEWESFKATVLAMVDDPRLDFAGASVTMPHKEHALRLAEEEGWGVDDAARACGVANTIVVGGDGVRVTNTDVVGVRDPLEDAIGGFAGKRVLVLGAGGAARAACVACAGAEVFVANRTRERGEALALDVGARLMEMDAIADERFDAVVQCTPVGMAGGPDAAGSPIEGRVLDAWATDGGGPVIFDTVYTPVRTPLLAMAEERSMRTIPGLAMFVGQARAQSELWTGMPAPTGVMRRVAEEVLASPPGG